MKDSEKPSPAHHQPGGFKNLHLEGTAKNFWQLLKWKIGGDGPQGDDAERRAVPRVNVDTKSIQNPEAAQITWLGHSTMLVQMHGIAVLTDPIFSKRASPVGFAGPARYQAPALSIEQLPPIDYAIISHNHYDHLDKPTVQAIGEKVHWLVPLGLKAWFNEAGIERVTEFDWWDDITLDGTRFVATPSQHWSARSLTDRYETLWASWLVQKEDTRFWFAGDTGYNPHQFKEIGERLGPIDCAAIPIGAYEPRWFMKDMHVNPEEAVMIHRDIGSRFSVGMHWGTFQLTDEAPLEPRTRLLEARAKAGLDANDFTALAIGETARIPAAKEKTTPEQLVKDQLEGGL